MLSIKAHRAWVCSRPSACLQVAISPPQALVMMVVLTPQAELLAHSFCLQAHDKQPAEPCLFEDAAMNTEREAAVGNAMYVVSLCSSGCGCLALVKTGAC